MACLLTMAAVARRMAEFGTLKALGWRSRRIVAQVLGESVVIGVAGAAAGVGLCFAGAAIIATVAPNLVLVTHDTASPAAPSASASWAKAASPSSRIPGPGRFRRAHTVTAGHDPAT